MQPFDTSWGRINKVLLQLAVCWFGAVVTLILLDMKSNLAIWALTAETLELRDGIQESTVPWLHGMPVFAILLAALVYSLGRFGRLNEYGWLAKWGAVCLAAFIMEALRVAAFGVSVRLQLHTILAAGFSAPLIFAAHELGRRSKIKPSTSMHGWPPSAPLSRALGALVLFGALSSSYLVLMRAIDTQCITKMGRNCVSEDLSSRIEDVYIPPPANESKNGSMPRPLQAGFQLEKLDQQITNILGDIDGNGSVDFVYFNDLRPTIVLNSKGTLHTTNLGLDRHLDFPVAQIAMADVNRDGLADLVVVRKNFDPNLLHRIIRGSAFYPVVDEQFSLKVLLQTKPGAWRDATDEMFRGKHPAGFVKVEPIVFADVTGDGWLDIIWQQYPHRLFGSLNAVYVRGDDGRYIDRMAELFDSQASRIMPEGADFADVNGDGEIDLFAFGYPNIARNGKYYRACANRYAHIPCEVSRRIEEGATFFDLGGAPHLAVAYWGTAEVFPQKALYFFKATSTGDFTPVDTKSQGVFRGINTYLVAKDLDLDGTEEILTSQPGRLLVWKNGRFWDALPAIAPELRGKKIQPIGLVDFDDDGDIDILLNVEGEKATYLLRNNLNPKSFLRLSARAADGTDNQFGATLTFKSDDDEETWWRAYRPRRGYWGDTDPRIVVKPRIGHKYSLTACFPSSLPLESVKPYSSPMFSLRVSKSAKNCISYELTLLQDDAKVDLTLLAGGAGFRVSYLATDGKTGQAQKNRTP